jgi:hypothetical protein
MGQQKDSALVPLKDHTWGKYNARIGYKDVGNFVNKYVMRCNKSTANTEKILASKSPMKYYLCLIFANQDRCFTETTNRLDVEIVDKFSRLPVDAVEA